MLRSAAGLLLLACAACTPIGESTSSLEGATPAGPPAPPLEPSPNEQPSTEPFEDGPQTPPDPRARPEPEPCSGVPAPSPLPGHADLELRVKSKIGRTLELGQPIELTAAIHNGSKTDHHQTVLTGDGSESGWREPHVWYSGFIDTGDGCWRPLETQVQKRCGLFDEDWRDEVVDLAPGTSAPLEWISDPGAALDIEDTGRVRLFLHYAYRAGDTNRGQGPEDLGAMVGVEAFELVSEPIEFKLRSALKLELDTRPHRGRGNVSRISDLVTLRLENTSRKARLVRPPTSTSLQFEVVGEDEYHPSASWRSDEALRSVRLRGGDSVELLGESSPNAAFEVHWYPPKAEVVRIRASYHPYGAPWAPALKSNWVEVDLR